MSKFLPLYSEDPVAPIEKEKGCEPNGDCSRCTLSGLTVGAFKKEDGKFYIKERKEKGSREFIDLEVPNKRRVANVCMKGRGVVRGTGGILLVGSKPTHYENTCGPFRGKGSAYVVEKVKKNYSGPITCDYAVRCPPASSGRGRGIPPTTVHAAACRTYLKETLDEVKPSRIFVFGTLAAFSVLGRSPSPLSVRRGNGWLYNDGDPIPVFFFPAPELGYQNSFIKKWIDEDLEWACSVNIEKLRKPMYDIWDAKAYAVEEQETAKKCAEEMRRQEFFAWDVETSGAMHRHDFKVICLGMAGSDEKDTWIWTRKAMKDPACIEVLRELMEDKSVGKVEHNGKFDRRALKAAYDINTEGNVGDTQYWKKMLESEESAKLEDCQELVGMGGGKEENEKAKKDTVNWIRRKATTEEVLLERYGDEYLEHAIKVKYPSKYKEDYRRHIYGLIPRKIVYSYCARDAKSTMELAKHLKKKLEKAEEVKYIWDEVVGPASEQMIYVESWGIKADTKAMNEFARFLKSHIDEIVGELQSEYGEDFNPGSPRHLVDLLFNKLDLPIYKKSDKTGVPSTDAKVLKRLKGRHPVVDKILKLRGLEKMYGTYAEGMKEHIRDDGRIHPNFRLDGARTGRLSCTEPNLQNIPNGKSDDPWEKKISKMAKNVFVAEEGNVLLQLDYSQLELRVATLLAEDPEMLKIWLSGEDYHRGTARLIAEPMWGISEKQWSSMSKDDQDPYRSAAKAFNFGLLYGMTDNGLAQRIGCSRDEAAYLRNAILGTFTKLDEFFAETLERTKRTGLTWTYWNGKLARRRQVYSAGDIRKSDEGNLARWQAKNQSGNTPVQGCLPYDSRILTREGIVKIGEAPLNGEAWTGNKWARYKKLNRGKCELALINFKNGAELTCDTRHKVLVEDGEEYSFKEWANLKEGDKVCFSLAKQLQFGTQTVDENTAYWMGFALGNGCTSHGKAHANALSMTFGDRKGRYTHSEHANAYRDFLVKKGFTPQATRKFENKTTVVVEDKSLSEMWSSLGYCWGVTAAHKRLPSFIWKASFKERCSLIVGLMDADGTVGDRGKTTPSLHLCQKEILEEVQILARTVGVDSTLRGPYGTNKSYRLDLNRGQLAAIGYGDAKRMISMQSVPGFVVKEFLSRIEGMGIKRGSDKTIVDRLRKGGTTSVYTLEKMCESYGLEMNLYSTSEVLSTKALGHEEETYTLSVDDPSHRFDSEGVISKNTASDYCLASVASLTKWIRETDFPAKLVLTVHDSIIFEVPEKHLVELHDKAKSVMEGWYAGEVPLDVDAEVGRSWGDLKKYEDWLSGN